MSKFKLIFSLLAAVMLAASPVLAQLTEAQRVEIPVVNLLQNPGFEAGLTKWTNSGGTFAHVTSGSSKLFGNGSATFTASAGSQYFQSSLVTVPYGLANKPCLAQIAYKGGDTNLKLQVIDSSSNIIAERALESAATDQRPFAVPFQCGNQGTQYRLKVLSTAAAALIAVDRAHLGEFQLNSFVDAIPNRTTVYTSGSGTFSPQSSTRWIRVRMVGGGAGGSGSGSASNGNGGLGGDTTFGPNTAGGAPANASATAGGDGGAGGTATIGSGFSGFGLTGSRGQTYNLSGTNAIFATGGSGGGTPFGEGGKGPGYNGGGKSALANTGAGGSGGGANEISGVYSGTGGGAGAYIDAVTTTVTSFAYSIGSGGSAGTAGTSGTAGGTGGSGYIVVDEYGYAGGQAFTPQSVAWRVDANIAGANPSLGTANVSSYSEITNGSLTLTQNAGSLSVGIACTSGTASTVGATTCNTPAVNESVGITFNVPAAGDVLACASFSHHLWVNADGDRIETAFQIVETSASSSAILQEGKSRIPSALDGSAAVQHDIATPLRLCGTFSFSTAGQKTLRLAFEQNITGTPDGSEIYADASASVGQRDIHWEVTPQNQTVPAPVLVGPWAQTTAVKTSAYSIIPSDEIVQADTTSSAFALTLPTAATAGIGKIIRIARVNSGSNLLTVQRSGSDTIGNGLTSTVLHAKGESIMLYSDGTNWQWLSDPYRYESALIAGSATTPTISSQIGNWLSTSITRNAAADYSLTIQTGIFSSTPHCTVTPDTDNAASNTIYSASVFGRSSTSLRYTFRYIQGGPATVTTSDVPSTTVICRGPR